MNDKDADRLDREILQNFQITPLASIESYCLVTELHVCEQLAQNRYLKV